MRQLIRLPLKLAYQLRRRGMIGTGAWFWHHVSWRYREWRLGIETAEIIPWQDLSEDPDCVEYEPIDYRCFDIAMSHLQGQPQQDVLLDYGCGKGRAVVLAAMYPFKKVIGVERSAFLCRLANRNLEIARKRLACRVVEIIHTDATEFPVPPEVTVIFLFNPFTGPILDRVIRRIQESLAIRERRITIFYMVPAGQDGLVGEWLTKVGELPTGIWDHVRFDQYQTVPGTCQTISLRRDIAESSTSSLTGQTARIAYPSFSVGTNR